MISDKNRADRAWSHLTDAFAWLKLHSHPSDVSGKRHRLAIYQAVMYLAKFTERPMSKARQRWVIGAQTIAAISSLLSNDMNLDLQERACAALANILSNCTVRALADDLSRWAAPLTPALPQLESEGIVHIDDEEEAAASAEDSARTAQEANDAALARRLVSTA